MDAAIASETLSRPHIFAGDWPRVSILIATAALLAIIVRMVTAIAKRTPSHSLQRSKSSEVAPKGSEYDDGQHR